MNNVYQREDMGRWGISRTLFGYPLPRIRDGKLGFYLWKPPYDGGWLWFEWPRETKKVYFGRLERGVYWCIFGFCGRISLAAT